MKRIHIIGGGLAGLGLGIILRERNVPVTLTEAKAYPRHKVCGEFVSGRGLDVLAQLGFGPWKIGIPIETITFHHGARNSRAEQLPERAAGVRRYALDSALAKRFVDLGGDLHCPVRFQGPLRNEGDVMATGRRLKTDSKWKWYGVKAHLTGVEQESDLELHFVENGYAGLCKVDAHTTNICGLFRRRKNDTGPALDIREHFTTIPSLADRLRNASWDATSFAAVSGLPIGNGGHLESNEFAIGDALSMVPPFTGNGMSVALESAASVADPLRGYAAGELTWTEAFSIYKRDSRKAFQRRMTVADSVQKLLMNSFCRHVLMAMVRPIPFWRRIFSATR